MRLRTLALENKYPESGKRTNPQLKRGKPRFRHRPSVPIRAGFAYQIQTMCDMRIPVDKNVDKLRLSIR